MKRTLECNKQRNRHMIEIAGPSSVASGLFESAVPETHVHPHTIQHTEAVTLRLSYFGQDDFGIRLHS